MIGLHTQIPWASCDPSLNARGDKACSRPVACWDGRCLSFCSSSPFQPVPEISRTFHAASSSMSSHFKGASRSTTILSFISIMFRYPCPSRNSKAFVMFPQRLFIFVYTSRPNFQNISIRSMSTVSIAESRLLRLPTGRLNMALILVGTILRVSIPCQIHPLFLPSFDDTLVFKCPLYYQTRTRGELVDQAITIMNSPLSLNTDITTLKSCNIPRELRRSETPVFLAYR